MACCKEHTAVETAEPELIENAWPAPPSPTEGGRYVQCPETGELIKVDPSEEV
jgi:hypothetical protein